jgi:hypothetical protein
MLSLSNIDYTIWEYKNDKWSIAEAIQGTHDEAVQRADELKTSYPDSAFGIRTAWPVDRERLKKAHVYGRTPEEK